MTDSLYHCKLSNGLSVVLPADVFSPKKLCQAEIDQLSYLENRLADIGIKAEVKPPVKTGAYFFFIKFQNEEDMNFYKLRYPHDEIVLLDVAI